MRDAGTLFLLVAVLTVLPVTAGADSDQAGAPDRGGKGRVLGTVIGAAAGFGVGLVAGLTWFDDAINSDRKVWTTALGFAGAGGVAGYFIGRSVDRRSRSQPPVRPALRPAELDLPRNLEWRNWTRDLPRAR